MLAPTPLAALLLVAAAAVVPVAAAALAPVPPDGVSDDCGVFPLAPDAVEQIRHRTLQLRGEMPAVGFPTRVRLGAGCGMGTEAAGPLTSRLELQGFGAGRDGHLRLTPGRPPDALPERLSDRLLPGVRLRAAQPLHSRILLETDLVVEVGARGTGGRAQALALHVDLGPFYGWVGRRAPAYGPGRSGGLILSGAVPLDGGGVGLIEPVGLPGFLEALGPMDLEVALARGSRNGDITAPWLLVGRGTLAPGAGFTLAVNRGLMFGGDGAASVTPRLLLLVLAGAHARDDDGEVVPFSNQIASAEVAWRGRVARWPLFAYLEWGMEDNSGAWIRSPGVVSGVEVAHPERPLRVGLERTYLSGVTGHGIWYRHSVYREGWSDRGRLLGHPLAGPGTEWLLHGALHQQPARDGGGRWEVELGFRTRDRLPQNSYAPALQGRSYGGFLGARVAVDGVELFGQVDGERLRGGDGRWIEGRAGVRWKVGGYGEPRPPRLCRRTGSARKSCLRRLPLIF